MFGWRNVCLWGCALLLTSRGEAFARSEFRLGVGAENSFAAAASEAGVEYVVVNEEGQILERRSVVAVPFDEAVEVDIRDWGTIGEGARANGMVDVSDGSLIPVWIDPTDNLIGSLADRRGFVTRTGEVHQLEIGSVQNVRDGDPNTAMVHEVLESPFEIGINNSFIENVVVNLGWDLPVNRVRFYPRPDFEGNFLPWYELGVVPSSAPIVDRPVGVTPYILGDLRRGKRWFQGQNRSGGSALNAKNDPMIEIIESTVENFDVTVDRRFPTRHVKFVTLRPLNPERTWEIAEFEVFGEGYVQQTVYRTDILDFGRPVAWSRIRWRGEQPEGTRVELRTRAGNTEQPFRYRRRVRTGQLVEVDRQEYNDVFNTRSVLDPFGRTAIELGSPRRDDVLQAGTFTKGYNVIEKQVDLENWSTWSSAYDFVAGLRDTTQAAPAWADVAEFLSKSPARYLQLEVVFHSTADTAPRIDQVELLFGDAVAEAVIGEISPTQTESFEPHTFTYVVRPILQEGNNGFDRLEIVTGTRADRLRSVKVDDVEVGEEFLRDVRGDRIVVGFDLLSGDEDTEKRIEVVFDAPVLRFSQEFSGFVFSSDDPDIRQQVQEGNSTLRFGDNTLSVRTPRGAPILGQPRAIPAVFSPNGDGVNDESMIRYQVRVLGSGVPHEVTFYDLAGRVVRRLVTEPAAAGVYERPWDGRDEAGARVLPGTYVYTVKVEADRGEQLRAGALSVVY